MPHTARECCGPVRAAAPGRVSHSIILHPSSLIIAYRLGLGLASMMIRATKLWSINPFQLALIRASGKLRYRRLCSSLIRQEMPR